MKQRYVVMYEIKVKGTRQLMEENSLIVYLNPMELSLKQLKKEILMIHQYDPAQHYVHLENIVKLTQGQESKTLLETITEIN